MICSISVPRGRRGAVKVGVKQVGIWGRNGSSASNQPWHHGWPNRPKTAPVGFSWVQFQGVLLRTKEHFVPRILLIWHYKQSILSSQQNSRYHNFAESLHGQMEEQTKGFSKGRIRNANPKHFDESQTQTWLWPRHLWHRLNPDNPKVDLNLFVFCKECYKKLTCGTINASICMIDR